MAAFILKNTLSENGSVTRGICKVEGKRVVDIIETKNIGKESDQVVANGSVLDPDSFVSMNMWGFPSNDYDSPAFINLLQEGFIDFFKNTVQIEPLTSEYLLPIFIGDLLRDKRVTVELLDIHEKWFGVTYKEDAEIVVQNMQKKIADGIYKEHLYDDLI